MKRKYFLVIAALTISMALDSTLRAVANVFFFGSIGLLGLMPLSKAIKTGRIITSPRSGAIVVMMILIIAKDVILISTGSSFTALDLTTQLACLLLSVVLFTSVCSHNWQYLFKGWSITIYSAGLVLGLFSYYGIDLPIHENFPAALMAPLAIFHIYKFCKRAWLGNLAIIIAMTMCILTESRAALACILIALIFKLFWKILGRGGGKYIFISLFGLGLLAQTFVAIWNDPFSNAALTNRPVLWNFYLEKSLERPIFGHGPTSSSGSAEAAARLSSYLDRGVAESYGPQSMYLRYFYESGLLGLALLAILLVVLPWGGFGSFISAVYLLVSFSESSLIGLPSVFGMPLIFGLSVAFAEKRRPSEIAGSSP